MSHARMSCLTAVVLFFGIALASLAPVSASEPTGRWKGRWSSSTSGHSGPMRARVRATSDGSYQALFAGRFAGVIPFAYRAKLTPVTTWNGTTYVSEKKLGPLLGSYRLQAVIPGDALSAQWSAVGDSGQIQMSRISR